MLNSGAVFESAFSQENTEPMLFLHIDDMELPKLFPGMDDDTELEWGKLAPREVLRLRLPLPLQLPPAEDPHHTGTNLPADEAAAAVFGTLKDSSM